MRLSRKSAPGARPLGRRVLVGLAASLAVALAPPVGESIAAFQKGLLDAGFGSPGSAVGQAVFDDARAAEARVVRFNLSWRQVATSKPANPADPGAPEYDFAGMDAAVREAAKRDLDVLMTITSAPNFAEGANRPGNVNPGTWKPDPDEFGKFAEAVAVRYSGSFTPLLGSTLPRVKYFQAWNEGNLDVHLSPQYQGGQSFMADHYRKMMNAFFEGVHDAQPNAQAITTGTGPYGDPKGGTRTRPLAFWREFFCLEGRRQLEPVACETKPKLDILAHHPINTTGGPGQSALHPDDSSTPDFKFVREILRKAERTDHVLPGGRGRPLWATELWWESQPGDKCGVTQKVQARYLKNAFRLLKRQGADAVIWLSVRDDPSGPNECGRGSLQSGLTRANGDRKPSFRAFKEFG